MPTLALCLAHGDECLPVTLSSFVWIHDNRPLSLSALSCHAH
ncbi:hypothetical protein BMETH_1441_0 [methanotrophic bacterial endosymbiont of Bathymodiolus sp.]|nr:hypothetical protein BMETH_1441_0 [methanotrophic bacterial endosymbiont of Bathymodiolus sp.]